MSKLLAVSFFMPPILASRSLQVARTLKHLSALGWECSVLSVEAESLRRDTYLLDPALELMYRRSFQVVRARTPENARLFRWLRRAVFKLGVPGAQAIRNGKALWVPSAIRAGRRLLADGGDFSAVVSFAMPWSSHVVGRALSRSSGLPWVAHFSDPWADSPYFEGGPFSRRLLDRIEAQIVRDADLVVFVTGRTADLVMRKYRPAWRGKVRVIPHGYDAELLSPTAAPGPSARLRLVHTGAFYGRRTPEAVLRALEILDRKRPLRDRLEVVFIGPKEQIYEQMSERLGLAAIVRFAGPRAHGETLRASAGADVCLVIDAPADAESVFLPSKLVDYLMLRKPILGITPPRGESADLLRRLGCPVVAPGDVAGIADAIEGLLGTWETNAPRVSPDYDRVASDYDVRTTARLLDAALRSARPPNERHPTIRRPNRSP